MCKTKVGEEQHDCSTRIPENPVCHDIFAMTNAIKAIKAEQIARLTTPAFSGKQDKKILGLDQYQ